MSETATCRGRLAQYCQGNGIDIGAGGDPIARRAICIDRSENDLNRAHVGKWPTHLIGDAANLYWFKDGSLDFVFSSHCLEDFEDTHGVLKEWFRVLKPGGNLVLFLPDQQAYEADCAKHGTLSNQAHKHANFSLSYVKAAALYSVETSEVIHELWP